MFVPLGSSIERKFLGKASPSVGVFVTQLFFALKVETAAFLESVLSSSWLPAAVNPHSPSLMFSLRIKQNISGQDVPRPVGLYQ